LLKILFKVILILTIIFCAFFVFFFATFNTQAFPSINQKYRDQFARNDFLKKIFKLDQIGDAKADLLTITKPNLDIIVAETGDFTLRADTDSFLENQIRAVTGAAQVKVREVKESEINDLSDPNVEKISRQVTRSEGSQNPLVVILLNKSSDLPTKVGLAINDRTILIFEGRINELSETESIRKEIERSTILHEFGHLIGLGHNQIDDCLMNESVESPGNQITVFLPQKFCDFELGEIEKMRGELES